MNPGKTFVWLLKRELWEYRGAMLWAPVVVAVVMVVLLALGLLGAGVVGHNVVVEVNGETVADVAAAVGDERMQRAMAGVAMGVMGGSGALLLIPAVVIFFYCLGALFNDRQDRSVLFWKSLPVSDTATVLSKLVTALLVAPLLTWAVAAVTTYVLLLLTSAAALAFGGGMALVGTLMTSGVLSSPFQMLAMLPLYALWALPTVGWLLLVSAWARGKPFLWAVGVPLAVGVLLAWLNHMLHLGWSLKWYWQDVVGRGLSGTVPGSWFTQLHHMGELAPTGGMDGVLERSLLLYGTPALWLGVLAGAAMVAGAIRLRRWRDAE
jgi:ABC-2 type transport system permease protein